ncbi:hypothetical protein ACLOJK_033455 [Asimina triloba]
MWAAAGDGLRLLRKSFFLSPPPFLAAAAIVPAPALEHFGSGRGRNTGGGGRAREDEVRSRKDGKADKIDALGRLLTRILRHMASQLNLEMRSDGFVRVRDLLQLNLTTFANAKLKSHTVDDIRELVESEKLLKPILSVDEVPDGMKLYVSDNKVILTEGFDGVVPVKYFEKIETWPNREPHHF